MAVRLDSKRRRLKKGEYEHADGRYTYRVMIEGKRYLITTYSLQELREKEEKFYSDLEKGIDLDKSKLTINDIADKYLSNKKRTVQITTYHTMTAMYDRYVRDSIGKKHLADLKRSNVKDYYLDLISGNKKISISTLSRLDTILKPMVEMAVNDDIILKNPFRGVIGEIRGESHFSNRKIPALTVKQQNAFMDYVFNMDKHIYIRNMIIFLLGTGCRIGETVGLRWSDIDFDRNTVSINHAVGYIRQNGHYRQIFKSTKSKAGEREIPMLTEVRKALLNEKRMQEILGLDQPVIEGYTGFVFLSERGTIFTRENVATQIKQIIKEYNEEHIDDPLPMFTTHQLRHTFATMLCRNTSDLKAIQKILGHADISTTLNVYADATEEGVNDSMKALEGVMFNNGK